MLLLCSPLISEQVFFLYINPTCAHKHTHTASSLWSTRLQPCKWARERNLLLSGTATGKQGITEAVSYSLCLQGQHAILHWGKVQHCATVWESIADHWHYIYLKHWDNGRLSSCFHTWLDCLVWTRFQFHSHPSAGLLTLHFWVWTTLRLCHWPEHHGSCLSL